MRKKFAAVLMFSVCFASACMKRMDIPTEVPTPPPPPAATPAPKLALKPDAELEKKIAEIAKDAKGKVGVAAVVLETGDAAMLNADQHFPMQSVYKLPIAMAVVEEVRQGKLGWTEHVGISEEDYVRKGQLSPMRDNPHAMQATVNGLIDYALVQSDGTASDVLLRVIGGPSVVQAYLTQIGIDDMKVVNSEKELGRDWQTQYENWTTPMAAVEILRFLDSSSKELPEQPVPDYIKDKTVRITRFPPEVINFIHIRTFMIDSIPGAKRIKGFLPKGTVVAHKTGTGGTQNGITSATNDIGIIYLPNGKRLAIAVFVSDSSADEKTREAVIAKIAKAAWDQWE